MMDAYKVASWQPVEQIGWTRKAYGRQIMHVSDGGTLKARLYPRRDEVSQIYLCASIEGRMLVQLFAGGQLLLEDLVTNVELDTFVSLGDLQQMDALDLELHMIPATFGTITVAQDLQSVALRARSTCAA